MGVVLILWCLNQVSVSIWQERQRGNSLFCPQGCCLLEGREVPALPGYGCFWIRIACMTVVVVLLVTVGFCERLVVS